MPNPELFDSIQIRDVEARNRLWVAPMCQYSVDLRDGVPTNWHLVHLGAFAVGGAGVVMTEATAVSAEGRISPEDTGIWNDEQLAAWVPVTRFIREHGAVPAIQLAHAGRKASTFKPWATEQGTVPAEQGGWQAVAPSAVAFDGYAVPVALDTDGIAHVVDDFVASALRSIEAGFEILEIHAAHGYLLHEFLSPLTNLRDDEYGGDLAGRARLLLEIVKAVRDAVGESVPLLVRFSATDWAEGGWDQQQTATVAGWARDAGADMFDISTGGLVGGVTIPVAPGYQVDFASFVGAEADVVVSAVGLITEAQHAAQIVSSGAADVVMLGREFLRDPHFPLRAAHELGVSIDYFPAQYVRAGYR